VFTTPIDAYSTIITLLIVLLVTSIKEAVEDVERAKSDRDENLSQATVVTFDRDGVEVEHVVDRCKVSFHEQLIILFESWVDFLFYFLFRLRQEILSS
jgi:hypothetical protein